jgi:hypothetical protein
MNPNIKRLIEDSGFYLAYENKEVTEKELEALIQLAVKQCASLTLDYRNREYYTGWLDYRDEIVEHFGIPE